MGIKAFRRGGNAACNINLQIITVTYYFLTG